MNYYELYDYVSNSNLNELSDLLSGKEKPENIQEIYNLGNLVDCMITEEHKLKGNTLNLEGSGGIVTFDDLEIEKARRMRDAYHARPDLKKIFGDARGQYVFIRKAQEIEYNGETFTLPARCKLDLYRRPNIGGDIKTTAAETDEQFKAVIDYFNYDQQSAWYMDLGRLDRFMLIGISKKERRGQHAIFTHLVTRGDDFYLAGRAKYSRKAYRYKNLVLPFKQ